MPKRPRHKVLHAAANDNSTLSPKPIEPSIDLTQLKRPMYEVYVHGGVRKPVGLHIIFKDASEQKVKTLGALRLTPRQWEELKVRGDSMLAAHRKLLRR